jgi:hypothetical protein
MEDHHFNSIKGLSLDKKHGNTISYDHGGIKVSQDPKVISKRRRIFYRATIYIGSKKKKVGPILKDLGM